MVFLLRRVIWLTIIESCCPLGCRGMLHSGYTIRLRNFNNLPQFFKQGRELFLQTYNQPWKERRDRIFHQTTSLRSLSPKPAAPSPSHVTGSVFPSLKCFMWATHFPVNTAKHLQEGCLQSLALGGRQCSTTLPHYCLAASHSYCGQEAEPELNAFCSYSLAKARVWLKDFPTPQNWRQICTCSCRMLTWLTERDQTAGLYSTVPACAARATLFTGEICF